MSGLEKKRIDRAFQLFAMRNFEKPRKCKNVEQVRFYLQELTETVKQYEEDFAYVPGAAYKLLSEYNTLHNSMVFEHFKNTY